MDRTEGSFPDVVEEIRKIPGDFLLDGEILGFREGFALPFAHIQRRLGRKVLSQAILRENPVKLFAFDILYLNGELLMDCPLRLRKEKLATLAVDQLPFQSVSSIASVEDAFTAARDRRNEGVVLKDPESL
jgi:DNA ligase-1